MPSDQSRFLCDHARVLESRGPGGREAAANFRAIADEFDRLSGIADQQQKEMAELRGAVAVNEMDLEEKRELLALVNEGLPAYRDPSSLANSREAAEKLREDRNA